jgi:hypothetical protein
MGEKSIAICKIKLFPKKSRPRENEAGTLGEQTREK